MYNSKIKSIIAVFIMYLFSFFVSVLLYPLIPIEVKNAEDILFKLLILDIISTIIIFIMSLIFKNSSIYDPYWSVSPIAISIAFLKLCGNINAWSVFAVGLISVWGIRLTINWAYKFNHLKHQDWRYTELNEKHPKTYFLINLFGIHLAPTIIVALALIPALNFIGDVGKAGFEPTPMTLFAYLFTLGAILIETVADIQLIMFKKIPSNHGLVMTHGLWKNSRHPNYFGEIAFWFGLFLLHYSLKNANPLLVFCPLVMFLLFVFISIPMMDKRQLETKASYKEYMESTNPLLPIFPPKQK